MGSSLEEYASVIVKELLGVKTVHGVIKDASFIVDPYHFNPNTKQKYSVVAFNFNFDDGLFYVVTVEDIELIALCNDGFGIAVQHIKNSVEAV